VPLISAAVSLPFEWLATVLYAIRVSAKGNDQSCGSNVCFEIERRRSIQIRLWFYLLMESVIEMLLTAVGMFLMLSSVIHSSRMPVKVQLTES
jgi:hypothetical protein